VKTEKKKETKKEDSEKLEKIEQTDTTDNYTSPIDPSTSPETLSDSNANKKKALNWIPLEIEHQRQHSNRGRGGPRAPRPPNNPNNPMSRPSWRSQGPLPNQRGARRGRGGGYNGMRQGYLPPTTVFYPVPLDPENLKQAVLTQIEYYFSIENLCKDMFLRGQMNEEGFLPLALIAGFNRVKSLTTDMQLIIETVQTSTLVECKEDKIRKKDDWKTWLLPKTTEQAKAV